VALDNVERIVISARFYQSFRGCYPTRVYRFPKDEEYQSLYVKGWQDATMMLRNAVPGVSVEADPSGESIHYVVHDRQLLAQLNTPEGIKFPCPIPENPERLNDVGMLRMQVRCWVACGLAR